MAEKGKRGRPRVWRPEMYACKIFFCDHRRGSFCCRECPQERHCANPCRNSPECCNAYRNKKETTQ